MGDLVSLPGRTKKVEGLIAAWLQPLGLGGWEVRYSPIPADGDDRASVEIDPVKHRAAIQIHAGCPDSQVEREVVHELLHIMLARAEDLFVRSVSDHQSEAREFLTGQWRRETEWAIERLVNVLTGIPFVQFGTTEVWESAFPDAD